MWARSALGWARCRDAAGWTKHSMGQARCRSWPARRGSFDIPRWGSPLPVGGQSRRCQREHSVVLSGGDRSSDDALDHGDMAGMTNEEIERAFPGELARRSLDKYQWRFPNGESYADADLRAASALCQVAESGSSRPLLVTHEMIARMLLRNLLTLEPKEALTLGLLHSVIYRVHVESKTVIEITS